MMKKWMAILCLMALVVCLAACGEEKETTISGMVISVDGTVVTLMEMDTENMGGGRPSFGGQMPSMPNGGDFQMPEDFDPENFDGNMPGGFNPGYFDSMPEGWSPENFDGTMPDGMEFPVQGGGQRPDNNFTMDADTAKTVDIANAHISVQTDGVKAGGSLQDIRPGAVVTITLNSKGQATYVLVIETRSMFGGGYPFGQ